MAPGNWELAPDRKVEFGEGDARFHGIMGKFAFRRDKLCAIAAALAHGRPHGDYWEFRTADTELYSQGIVAMAISMDQRQVDFDVFAGPLPVLFLVHERRMFAFIDTEPMPEDVLRAAEQLAAAHAEGRAGEQQVKGE